jgi:3-dehydroquinate synthase
MTTTVAVSLANRSYDIVIGPDLIAQAGAEIRARFGARKLIIITDESVARFHLPALEASLRQAGLEFGVVTVPAGEQSKDLHRFPELCERLLDFAPERGVMLVALGGGVVGDLTGFAAASLLRGVDFVQIPTTLLAQIDSSVGGKTGVNTRQGKNLIGAFHQPRLVLADLSALATLPARELRAGYAEMIKYGVLGDGEFFTWLESHGAAVLRLDADELEHAVAHCCRMKAEIVAEDEREAGRRALLNLGHTFGHALEAETGFGETLLHGESVAIGMALAADLSARLGRITRTDADRIARLIAASGCPVEIGPLGTLPADRLIAHMGHDKKVEAGRITFVVIDAIGRAVTTRDVAMADVRAVLKARGAA